MKNNTTELVFILDRSGSMAGLERDTVGGFNAMLERQKAQEGACFVTTVLFDNTAVRLHDRLPMAAVPPMTNRDYRVGGATALVDAIGETVTHIENIHRYARPEDVPAHTMFVITTDGQENASHRFEGDQVRGMIQKKTEENGWEFLFLGANIDAAETAARYAIPPENAIDYLADEQGTQMLYEGISDAVTCVRANRPLSAEACNGIRADFAKRGPRRKKP